MADPRMSFEDYVRNFSGATIGAGGIDDLYRTVREKDEGGYSTDYVPYTAAEKQALRDQWIWTATSDPLAGRDWQSELRGDNANATVKQLGLQGYAPIGWNQGGYDGLQDAINRSQAAQSRGIKTVDDYYRNLSGGNSGQVVTAADGTKFWKSDKGAVDVNGPGAFDMGLASPMDWTGKLTLGVITAIAGGAAMAAMGGAGAAAGAAEGATAGAAAEGAAAGGAAASGGAAGAASTPWYAGLTDAAGGSLVAPEAAGSAYAALGAEAAGAAGAAGAVANGGATQEALVQTIQTGAPATAASAGQAAAGTAAAATPTVNASAPLANMTQAEIAQMIESGTVGAEGLALEQAAGIVTPTATSPSLVDSVLGWAKENKLLASTGLSVAGGLIKGAMSESSEEKARAVANAKVDMEKRIADQIRANNNLSFLTLGRLRPTGRTIRRAGELPPGIINRARGVA